jgi:hypothetical protein
MSPYTRARLAPTPVEPVTAVQVERCLQRAAARSEHASWALGPDVEPQPDAANIVTVLNTPIDQVGNRIILIVRAMRDPRQGTRVTRDDAFRPGDSPIAQSFW